MVMHRFSFTLAPDNPPINITATVMYRPNITFDYVIITWQPVNEGLNGKLRAYNIRWRPAAGNASYKEERINITSSQSRRRRRRRRSTNTIGDCTNDRIFELRNLSIYTNYSVAVAAVTVKVGVYSDPKYFLSQQGGMR